MSKDIGRIVEAEILGDFSQDRSRIKSDPLSKRKILDYFRQLDQELKERKTKGEILIYGGAVMVLAFDARPVTKDVDAIFVPKIVMRDAIKKVAENNGISEDWLNDGVGGFQSSVGDKKLFLNLPNLAIYIPTTEYLLAMKVLSSRVDTKDRTDIAFLIEKLQIKTVEEIFNLVEKYYPRNRIEPRTKFFIEEMFDDINS